MGECRGTKTTDVLEIEIHKINSLIGKLMVKENNIVKNTIKINMYRDRLDKLEKELNSKRGVLYGGV